MLDLVGDTCSGVVNAAGSSLMIIDQLVVCRRPWNALMYRCTLTLDDDQLRYLHHKKKTTIPSAARYIFTMEWMSKSFVQDI